MIRDPSGLGQWQSPSRFLPKPQKVLPLFLTSDGPIYRLTLHARDIFLFPSDGEGGTSSLLSSGATVVAAAGSAQRQVYGEVVVSME